MVSWEVPLADEPNLIWDRIRTDLLDGALPSGSTAGIVVVVEDSCSGDFSFLIENGNMHWLGRGKTHDVMCKSHAYAFSFELLTEEQRQYTSRSWEVRCDVTFSVHPSSQYRDQNFSRSPMIISFVAFVFFVISTALLLYNSYIQMKQQKIIAKASRSEAIVQSLFPINVRERLLVDGRTEITANMDLTYNEETERTDDGPIADLFPSCSVIFMDLANFTAWSRYG